MSDPRGDARLADELDTWARRLKTYASSSVPDDLPVLTGGKPKKANRDVFAFFVSGEKARNPDAAMALTERLG